MVAEPTSMKSTGTLAAPQAKQVDELLPEGHLVDGREASGRTIQAVSAGEPAKRSAERGRPALKGLMK
jgi:hypothetical protein